MAKKEGVVQKGRVQDTERVVHKGFCVSLLHMDTFDLCQVSSRIRDLIKK